MELYRKREGLFKDLECELHTLAIAMVVFINILDEIAKIEDVVNYELGSMFWGVGYYRCTAGCYAKDAWV